MLDRSAGLFFCVKVEPFGQLLRRLVFRAVVDQRDEVDYIAALLTAVLGVAGFAPALPVIAGDVHLERLVFVPVLVRRQGTLRACPLAAEAQLDPVSGAHIRNSDPVFDRFEVDHLGLLIRSRESVFSFRRHVGGVVFPCVFHQHQLGMRVQDERQADVHLNAHAVRFAILPGGANLEPRLAPLAVIFHKHHPVIGLPSGHK